MLRSTLSWPLQMRQTGTRLGGSNDEDTAMTKDKADELVRAIEYLVLELIAFDRQPSKTRSSAILDAPRAQLEGLFEGLCDEND
jgi:hypothetical protein